jgi:hypothetical protein
MFVTSDRAVFDRYTSKNATLMKTAENDTEKRENKMRQILMNILVQGMHRSRQHFRRTKRTVKEYRPTEDWENIAGFDEVDDDDDMRDVFEALQIITGTEPSGFEKAITDVEAILQTDALLTFAQLHEALTTLKRAKPFDDDSRKIVQNVTELYKRKRQDTKQVFENAKENIKELWYSSDSLLQKGWNSVEIAKKINDQINIMNDVQSKSGLNFLYKLKSPQFLNTHSSEITRCTPCRDAERFPMILIAYDESAPMEVRPTYPPGCKCIANQLVSKLIFLPDATALYMQKSSLSNKKERFASLFLFNIDRLFIHNKERVNFKLQFIYLTREHYLNQSVYVTSPSADVVSVQELNPLDALASYIDQYLNEGANELPDTTAMPAETQQPVSQRWGIVSAVRDLADMVSPYFRTPTNIFEEATGTRAPNRRNLLYDPLTKAITNILKNAYQDVPVNEYLTFTTITGNTRLRFAIEATIDLYKSQMLGRFVVVSPRKIQALQNIMKRELQMLGAEDEPQFLETVNQVSRTHNTILTRLLIAPDAEGLVPGELLPVDTVYYVFGPVLQQLELNGLAVIMNHSMSTDDIAKFSSYYKFGEHKNVRMNAVNFNVNNNHYILFFYSKREGARLDVEAVRTQLFDPVSGDISASHGERTVHLITYNTPQASSISDPVSADLSNTQWTPGYLPTLSPSHNPEFADFDAIVQAAAAQPPITFESLLQPASLSLPSPLIGSRLWRSGTQLALMLRS